MGKQRNIFVVMNKGELKIEFELIMNEKRKQDFVV